MTAIFDQPPILFFVMLAELLLVVEIGRIVGQHLSVSQDTLRHEQLVDSRDAIGILMSLLLGFTLAMALSRYDQRKQLMVDEANAIGTASLRSAMLPDSSREKMTELLREYVHARSDFSKSALGGQQMAQSIDHTKTLQNQMWRMTVDVARTTPNAITSLFVQSLNEMTDLSEKRMSLLEDRVPQPIWIMLTLIALLSLGAGWGAVLGAEYLGAQSGLGYIIVYAQEFAFLDRMFPIALLFILYTSVSYWAISRLSARLLAWAPPSQRQ